MGREAQAGDGSMSEALTVTLVALGFILTVALLPVAVWAGMVWGRMQAEDKMKRNAALPVVFFNNH